MLMSGLRACGQPKRLSAAQPARRSASMANRLSATQPASSASMAPLRPTAS